MTIRRREAWNQHQYDSVFAELTSTPEMRALGLTTDRDGLDDDIRRIAGALFRGARIHQSVVGFAKNRVAGHWCLNEDRVDILVATQILQSAGSLVTDPRSLRPDHPPTAPTTTTG